jgi:hypothetical protein
VTYVRATKAEKERMSTLSRIRCVACWSTDLCCGKTEVHHTLSGGRRRGHLYTVPLGLWHHQGIPLPGYTTKQMRLIFGPSLRLHSKAFRAQYGTDDELLEKVNNLIIAVTHLTA